ncbi:MAG TPA: hypothetical protein DEP36_05555 [Gammaproteobacteria bacterium]|nr:hypothetical protein [Gammaproteobacteria bacterium]
MFRSMALPETIKLIKRFLFQSVVFSRMSYLSFGMAPWSQIRGGVFLLLQGCQQGSFKGYENPVG